MNIDRCCGRRWPLGRSPGGPPPASGRDTRGRRCGRRTVPDGPLRARRWRRPSSRSRRGRTERRGVGHRSGGRSPRGSRRVRRGVRSIIDAVDDRVVPLVRLDYVSVIFRERSVFPSNGSPHVCRRTRLLAGSPSPRGCRASKRGAADCGGAAVRRFAREACRGPCRPFLVTGREASRPRRRRPSRVAS